MSVIGEIQSIAKILQRAGNIELYEKLLTVQEEALELMEQNRNLREENSRLKGKLELKDSLMFKENAYYSIDKKGNIKDGPFCSRCWDKDDKLVRMHKTDDRHLTRTIWCPDCKILGGRK